MIVVTGLTLWIPLAGRWRMSLNESYVRFSSIMQMLAHPCRAERGAMLTSREYLLYDGLFYCRNLCHVFCTRE